MLMVCCWLPLIRRAFVKSIEFGAWRDNYKVPKAASNVVSPRVRNVRDCGDLRISYIIRYMVPREVAESVTRFQIWRGILTIVLYTRRKYSYFKHPIWMYVVSLIEHFEMVDMIINMRFCT